VSEKSQVIDVNIVEAELNAYTRGVVEAARARVPSLVPDD
jgi:hypothetical protein